MAGLESRRGPRDPRRADRVVAVAAWFLAAGLLVRAMVEGRPQPLGLHALAFPGHVIAAYLAADVLSGLVHFAADTYGSRTTPIVGPLFIGPFRDHHAAPGDITQHDFIDTNGNTAVPASLLVLAALAAPVEDAAWAWHLAALVGLVSGFSLLTNQIHRWAHQKAPPAPVQWLQRRRVILSPAHHDRHHEAPFASHYCITSGWTEAFVVSAAARFRRRGVPGPPAA